MEKPECIPGGAQETPVVLSAVIREKFSDSADFQMRKLALGLEENHAVWCVWIDGLVNGGEVSETVIRPLTEEVRLGGREGSTRCMRRIELGAVYAGSVKRREDQTEIVQDIASGLCALLFDREGAALTFDTKTTQQRAVAPPENEKSVKGAQDAFIETLRTNTSLVRRRLRTSALKLWQTQVGATAHTEVAVMWLADVCDPAVVEAVQKRLKSIPAEGLLCAQQLEEYMVSVPASPLPQMISTERADKFALNLMEGRAGILVNGLPLGFLVPVTLCQLVKVPEDLSQHTLVASLLTAVRWLGAALSLLMPGLYVAVAMYHQEMIPLRLLLSVISSEQEVPFSTAVEVLGMLISFELLQEAGLRLPNSVGQTVSIIGALIVGQSAVEARVISPIAVIVVAVAGIAGYTLPNQDLASALRLFRLGTVVAAIFAGLVGLMAVLVLLIWHLCSLESYGVGYMSPVDQGRGWLQALGRPALRRTHRRDPAMDAQPSEGVRP